MPKRFSLLKEEYKKLTKQIMQRDGWKCRVCKSRNDLHAHHIVYRSAGGGDYSWNLLAVCTRCHDAIHGLNSVVRIIILAKSRDAEEEPNADQGIRVVRLNAYNDRKSRVSREKQEVAEIVIQKES